LIIASDNIDEVIAIIRGSKNTEEARDKLIERFSLSDIQARAIVEMRLRQLTGLERERLEQEYNDLMAFIEKCKDILANESTRMEIIKNEMLEIKQKYGDERRSRIEYAASDFRIEDTIADEDVVVTISHLGYIKRTPLTEYHRQNRGGKGSKGSDVRTEDFVEHLFIASMHNYMLFFTEKGKCFWLRVYEIPEGTRQSKGRAIQNVINIEPEDKVKAFINIKDLKDQEYLNNNYIILCTKKGIIKKTALDAYSKPRQNGIIAITIRDNDQLLEAKLTNGSNEVMMALRSGKAVRFNENNVRPMGRSASGVRGITLQNEKDEVIGMICIDNPAYHILVVSENGYGKRSELDDYRETNRGGKGVKTISVTDKTGALIAIKNVTDMDDLMIINKSGIIIRLAVKDLRVVGRATQGVRLIDIRNNDAIASVTKVVQEEEEIEDETIEPEMMDSDSIDDTILPNNIEDTDEPIQS
ncbi:MAG: DNA gyrase C-terminal beta-propeller domain-containing protein, partial [Bacteroidales bacterium]